MHTALSTLSLILDEAPAHMQEIPDDVFDHKPSTGNWSKKEILGHLVDSAFNNIQRFIRAKYEDTPYIVYNQDEWVILNKYQSYDRETVVVLWLDLNRHIIHVMSSAGTEWLKKLCKTSLTKSPSTVEWLFIDYVKHLQYHLGKILPEYERKVEVYP